MTPEQFDAWYTASRSGQGLGEHVEDETVLLNLARLLAGTDRDDTEHNGRRRTSGLARRRHHEPPTATAEQTERADGAS